LTQISLISHDGASTFCEILRSRAIEAPETRAFVFLDSIGNVVEELSYAALERRAKALAVSLIANTLGGERVILMFPSGLDFVIALFACFYAGAVAVPVPVLSGKRMLDRISAIFGDAQPAGVLTLASLQRDAKASEVLNGFGKLVWIEIDRLDREPDSTITLPAGNPEALALLQYTSGSTNLPKGVKLTHANLVANSRMIAEAFGHDSSTRGVSWLPHFHDMGLVGHVLQPVYFGGLSVLMSPLSFLQRPVRWLQAISSWKATTSGGPTYAFELCVKAIREEQIQGLDLSSWRIAYCGSEKVRPEVLERFGTRFAKHGLNPRALRPCFGLAEATLLVSIGTEAKVLKTAAPSHNSVPIQQSVSCGPAARGSSIIVIDVDSKEKLADGVVGEIWVKGPHVAQGYWNARDEDTFCARVVGGDDGNYLRTGDLGFLKEGELFVVGRIKDTIIINGLKHSAEDIEATVSQSERLAGFSNAAFRIDIGGQEQAVFVQEFAYKSSNIDEVSQIVSEAFASVTREHGLRLFDFIVVRAGSLPRTSSGKIRRSVARDIYLTDGFKRLNREHLFSGAKAFQQKTSDRMDDLRNG
jgi:acyl-CoA synthetase (AMP-forming)/AMP-acid ligase II